MSSAGDLALAARSLRLTQPFIGWPDEVIGALAQAGHIARYSRRTQVPAQDPLQRDASVVVAGVLEISRTSVDGRKFVLSLVGPGQAIGLVRLVDTRPVSFDYYAHQDTVLLHLPCATLHELLDAQPLLWRDVAKLSLARQWESLGLLHDVALGSLGQRVATLLASLAELHGVRDGSGVALRLRLSQDDLGAMLGVSRQSVAKELRALETAGVVGADYSRIVIRNPDALGERRARPPARPRA